MKSDKINSARVVHLTSVHPRYDIRIFEKQCRSLAKNGYDVHLIVADSKGSEQQSGVNIHDIGRPKNRLSRFFSTTRAIYKKALDLNAAVYQFHDPELIPIGVSLAKKGYQVIYDIHENVAVSILDKFWIPKFLRPTIKRIYEQYEQYAIKHFSHLLVAPVEADYGYGSTQILNFPVVFDETDFSKTKEFQFPIRFVYAGAVSRLRAVFEMLEIFNGIVENGFDVHLDLIGHFQPAALELEVREYIVAKNLTDRVALHGYIPLNEVYTILNNSHIGFSILKPIKNYYNAIPTKIFDYMLKGIPVITSDFPVYNYYVLKKNTGLCLNYNDLSGSISKLSELLGNVELLNKMSSNGVAAVKNEFNWRSQEIKLLKLYDEIITNRNQT